MADSTKSGIFAPFEWMIAWRYLRAKRQERFISVISVISLVGIALGVATLIIVMSVMNGFRHDLLKTILGINGHITVQARDGGLTDFDTVAARIRAVPGVTRAAPIVDGQVMASQHNYNTGVLVRGMRRADLASLEEVSQSLTPGALNSYENGESVIIGQGLANKLGIAVGGAITLIAPEGNITPFGTTPRIKTYTVAGTFKIGNTSYDNIFVFMPLGEAQLFFNQGDGVNGIEVMVQDPERNVALLPAISNVTGPGVRLITWQQLNGAFFQAVAVERNVMFLILALIILVASLNLVSGLIMLVTDKSADIAILRTMGATRGAVMRVFLIAGMAIGVTGTLAGYLLGILFCLNLESIRQGLSKLTGTPLFDPTIYFLSRIPSQIDYGEVTSVVVTALVLSFLATIYPSWRAARLDPVEALRYG